MLVENWMSKDVVTVDVNDSMQYATRLLKEHKIRGLPVMEKGKLVGIVTDRDLKRASASDATTLEIHELLYLISKIKIKDIMTKNPITIPLDYTIDEAAGVLLENKLTGAPVVDNEGKVVGVITQTDIFRVLVSFTGVKKAGCQLMSILSSHDEQVDYRHVYIRVCDCDREKLGELKEELKAKANMLYMVDHVERNKEVYQDYKRPSGSWIVG
jgi:acetoin utilization protein AcuB